MHQRIIRNRTSRIHKARSLQMRGGSTLLELVVGVFVSSILLVGIGSAIFISLQGVNETTSPSSPISETAGALNQVQAEMSHALRFTERTDKAATFLVPDRDNNGIPETVRFEWSGTVGDPLTKSYNGSQPANLIENVNHFNLAYPLRSMTGTQPVALAKQESTEQDHLYHDDKPGGTLWGINITGSTRVAQAIQVPFSANVVSWKITKLWIGARSEGLFLGTLRIEITTKDADGNPGGSTLASVDVPESTLKNTYSWTEISIPQVSGITAGQELFVVIQDAGIGSPGWVLYEQEGVPMTSSTHYLVSTDGGSSWSVPNDTQDLLFILKGTYTTEEAL